MSIIEPRPPHIEVSFAEMRRALHEQPTESERAQEARQREVTCFIPFHLYIFTSSWNIACGCNKTAQVLLEKFQTASFAELCSITMANKPAESLYHCLNDIYGRFAKSVLVAITSLLYHFQEHLQ